MNKTQQLLKEREEKMEDEFNRKFGFGTWDSRAANNQHRNEGISSTNVLEFQRLFTATTISLLLNSLKGEVARRIKELDGNGGALGTPTIHTIAELSNISTLLSETISNLTK